MTIAGRLTKLEAKITEQDEDNDYLVFVTTEATHQKDLAEFREKHPKNKLLTIIRLTPEAKETPATRQEQGTASIRIDPETGRRVITIGDAP